MKKCYLVLSFLFSTLAFANPVLDPFEQVEIRHVETPKRGDVVRVKTVDGWKIAKVAKVAKVATSGLLLATLVQTAEAGPWAAGVVAVSGTVIASGLLVAGIASGAGAAAGAAAAMATMQETAALLPVAAAAPTP
ncbi:MAG: hypothetical protein OXT67_14050 [Zetaproteobacteria bacterium]|nr:hypothetical protein [Zetaproteobacteria bacterium]